MNPDIPQSRGMVATPSWEVCQGNQKYHLNKYYNVSVPRDVSIPLCMILIMDQLGYSVYFAAVLYATVYAAVSHAHVHQMITLGVNVPEDAVGQYIWHQNQIQIGFIAADAHQTWLYVNVGVERVYVQNVVWTCQWRITRWGTTLRPV